jgi:4'-phosphopantetheinyl transferase EntD
MIVATLLSDVLPDKVAAAEMYDDPPDLTPLPEEEPLIAKSVAKRRNEFVTVRYCARQALEELGVPPVPILKGEKGEPCWPDGVVGSLTHCDGYRGAAVGRHDAMRSVGIDAEPHDVLPRGVLDAISLPGPPSEARSALFRGRCTGTESCSAPRRRRTKRGTRSPSGGWGSRTRTSRLAWTTAAPRDISNPAS